MPFASFQKRLGGISHLLQQKLKDALKKNTSPFKKARPSQKGSDLLRRIKREREKRESVFGSRDPSSTAGIWAGGTLHRTHSHDLMYGIEEATKRVPREKSEGLGRTWALRDGIEISVQTFIGMNKQTGNPRRPSRQRDSIIYTHFQGLAMRGVVAFASSRAEMQRWCFYF